MRNLRKAALAAAMIGSLSMVGAGVASATDYDSDHGKDEQTRTCAQSAEQGNAAEASGLIAVNVALQNVGLLGNASQQNTAQQSCVNGDGSASWNAAAVESEQGGGNGILNILSGN
jgi:hypothetical protein